MKTSRSSMAAEAGALSAYVCPDFLLAAAGLLLLTALPLHRTGTHSSSEGQEEPKRVDPPSSEG